MNAGPRIHPSAVVHPGAALGNVTVGAMAYVGPDVVLADGVELRPHAVVLGPTSLGQGVVVHSFACIGGDPQDQKYGGEPTRLEVGRGTVFRENATVHRGTAAGGGVTRVGADCLIMACCHVAHDCEVGDGVVMANSAALAGHVQVADRAVLGGLSGVHQHARIGRLGMVAGGAMAAQDVPPFTIAQGDRARLVGLNLVALRRSGMPAERIAALRQAWRLLFGRRRELRAAMAEVEAQLPGVPEVEELLAFIGASRRGICRAATVDPSGRGGRPLDHHEAE